MKSQDLFGKTCVPDDDDWDNDGMQNNNDDFPKNGCATAAHKDEDGVDDYGRAKWLVPGCSTALPQGELQTLSGDTDVVDSVSFSPDGKRVVSGSQDDTLKIWDVDPQSDNYGMQKVESPPFHHTFGAEVDFYKLNEGEEWDYALRDGVLAFFDRPELSNTRSFMYWRIE